jgi:hypothetical protein
MTTPGEPAEVDVGALDVDSSRAIEDVDWADVLNDPELLIERLL